MKITSIQTLAFHLAKPKLLVLDEDTSVYVKQLKLLQMEELQKEFEELSVMDEEAKTSNDKKLIAEAVEKTRAFQIDAVAKLITDADGKLLVTNEEEKKVLEEALTVDFIRAFFNKFFSSFSLTAEELAAAEDRFPQKPDA